MDRRIKGNLMTDIFHMVGVVPTDRKKLKEKQADRKQDRLLYGNQAGLKRRSLAELRETPLHQLPDDDLEIIMESEDEFRRRGNDTPSVTTDDGSTGNTPPGWVSPRGNPLPADGSVRVLTPIGRDLISNPHLH